jgi:hypothetical protein
MNEEIRISKKSLKLLVAWVLVLIVGMIIGNLFPLLQLNETEAESNEETFTVVQGTLSDEDKQFLIGLADQQLMVTASQSDWCLALGGVWNESTETGTMEISDELAEAVQEAGGTVTEREGTYLVSADLIKRDGCILIKK